MKYITDGYKLKVGDPILAISNRDLVIGTLISYYEDDEQFDIQLNHITDGTKR